jgi:pilus assembly protein Flp/PilA
MLNRFIRDETAATAIEYALIAAIISLAILAGAGTLSDQLRDTYGGMATKIEEAGATGP